MDMKPPVARDAARRGRDGRARYRSLFAAMSEIAAYHRLERTAAGEPVDYRILDVNPSYEAVLGLGRDEVKDRLASEVYGSSPPPYLSFYAEAVAARRPMRLETYYEPMGKYFVISVVSPRPEHFYTVSEDITERRLRELEQTRLLGERSRLLIELERKNAELERYLYIASHDLRSPLVNLRGFGERIRKASAELAALLAGEELSSEDRHRALAIARERIPASLGFMQSSTERMERLVQGILTLSRTGRSDLSESELDVEELIAQAAEALGHQLAEAGATLCVDTLPRCTADRDLLTTAFTNILENAVKYRSDDEPLRILVYGSAKGRDVSYCVADNGLGMPDDFIGKAFELFARHDPFGTVPGDGIGLAQVRKIAERHGGAVVAGPSERGGTRVTLTLPGRGLDGGAR